MSVHKTLKIHFLRYQCFQKGISFVFQKKIPHFSKTKLFQTKKKKGEQAHSPQPLCKNALAQIKTTKK